MKCLVCGSITDEQWRKGYCSQSCYARALYRRSRSLPVADDDFAKRQGRCSVCGSTYTLGRSDHRTCSTTCRVKAFNQRRYGVNPPPPRPVATQIRRRKTP